MDTTNLFEITLNLPALGPIAKIDFKPDLAGTVELHINLSFLKGSQFACPECGTKATTDYSAVTYRNLLNILGRANGRSFIVSLNPSQL